MKAVTSTVLKLIIFLIFLLFALAIYYTILKSGIDIALKELIK